MQSKNRKSESVDKEFYEGGIIGIEETSTWSFGIVEALGWLQGEKKQFGTV